MAKSEKAPPPSQTNLVTFAILAAVVALGVNFISAIVGDLVSGYGPAQVRDLITRSLRAPAANIPSAAPVADSGFGGSPYVRVFSYDPFIAHIVDLVAPEERAYLKQLAQPLLAKSTVVVDGESVEHEARTSSTAFLPEDDPVVRNITARVQDFQGYMDYDRIDLQVTSYQEGQQYQAHYDWYEAGSLDTNRFSTFFATLESSCEDCGTHFPEIRVDWSQRNNEWCKFMDCTKDTLTTKNIPGGALYWRNLDNNFYGRPDTLHAGLPAHGGYKMGLNIWTEIRMPPHLSKTAHEPPKEEQVA